MKKKILPTEETPAPAPSPEAPEVIEDVVMDGEKVRFLDSLFCASNGN